MNARVYVEGGGNGNKALRAECRRACREFFQKAGLAGRLPRVVPGGSRKQRYDDFCTAFEILAKDAFAVLLVDSEDAVAEHAGPWTHLKNRRGDRWSRPAGATDEHAHLMVQCMEAWFLSDRDALSTVFGSGFRPDALPGQASIELIPKKDVFAGLANATRGCRRRGYRKGRDSFEVLARMDPEKLTSASPHAARLVRTLRERL